MGAFTLCEFGEHVRPKFVLVVFRSGHLSHAYLNTLWHHCNSWFGIRTCIYIARILAWKRDKNSNKHKMNRERWCLVIATDSSVNRFAFLAYRTQCLYNVTGLRCFSSSGSGTSASGKPDSDGATLGAFEPTWLGALDPPLDVYIQSHAHTQTQRETRIRG